jgi:hypothetical protein
MTGVQGTQDHWNKRSACALSSHAKVIWYCPQPRRGFLPIAQPFKAGSKYETQGPLMVLLCSYLLRPLDGGLFPASGFNPWQVLPHISR